MYIADKTAYPRLKKVQASGPIPILILARPRPATNLFHTGRKRFASILSPNSQSQFARAIEQKMKSSIRFLARQRKIGSAILDHYRGYRGCKAPCYGKITRGLQIFDHE